MGTIVGAILCTHAYTFVEPERWDDRRTQRTRRNYAAKYGSAPPERPEIAGESLEANRARYGRIREAFEEIRRRLRDAAPDTIVVIGNDQDENFTPHALPQFAVFTGERFVIRSRTEGAGASAAPPAPYRAAPRLARTILETALERGFDPAAVEQFTDDALEAHAHREPLRVFDPDGRLRVVPVFVNAIHRPTPSPARCYAFGDVLREAIERDADAGRVLLFASGGLSHFPADYPWPEYDGPLTIGAISADFDRRLVAEMARGNGAALGRLSNGELAENGDDELRQTIVMLGAIGAAAPSVLVYEPFYRAIMGMAVGCWDFAPVPVG